MESASFLGPRAFVVLESLVNHTFHLRALAEEAKLPPSTLHKILSRLLKQKMVVVETVKNRKVFGLNYDSPLTTRAISLLFIDKIVHSNSFAKLVQVKPKGILLFGTCHSGKVSATSDIDLAVFFEKKPDLFKISQIKSSLSNELLREIDLIVLTREKIKSMKEQEAELLNQIVNKSTVLWGEPIDLG